MTSADGAVYLDSSAIVKRTEVGRALLAWDAPTARRGALVLEGIDLVAIADPILAEAATLQSPQLRSLDAIHIATAHRLGADLLELVTYDHRIQAAAEVLGIRVAAPRLTPPPAADR